jgi:PhzF family phenazine biosynthesis protein
MSSDRKYWLWQVDAFARKPFEGNPAGIILLPGGWPETSLMQSIANENNLSETAFLVWRDTGKYELRWFTPEAEVDLCGHATLASAWLIFSKMDSESNELHFETRSGTLKVQRGENGHHVMSLPTDPISPFDPPGFAEELGEALGTSKPSEVYKGRYVLAVFGNAHDVRAIKDCGNVASVLRKHDIWGCIVTAPGDEGYDFVSRFFAPDKGVPEDPVTGSAHCTLTPYWAKRLGKKTLKARQVSPRGGDLICTDDGARTILSGPCALYMKGEISV